MRFIDLDKVFADVSEDWLERSAVLRDKLIEEKDIKSKKKIIDDNSNLWGEIKDILALLSNQKCWYTDTRVIAAEGQIDHFRPKSGVLGIKHNGYWWLSFDYKNFRYTRKVANSRLKGTDGQIDGKGTYFRILDEATRCRNPEDDLDKEKPYLLDPCCVSDVKLMIFSDNGEPISRYSEDTHPFEYERVRESIKTYGIKNITFTRERRQLAINIIRLLKEADGHLSRGDHDNLKGSLDKLARIVAPSSEFSSFSRAYLKNHSAGREYLDGLLDVV